MTPRTLITRSLRFHWRSHLGVVLGAAIGSAALIGALIVGDSVRESLRERAFERLGPYAFAFASADRFFTQQLAEKMQINSALHLPATAARQDGSARANQINLIGVQSNFWGSPNVPALPQGHVLINEALAAQLNARSGDEVILRVHKASVLSRDVPITPQSDASVALRMVVHGVVPAAMLGNFSLRPSQTPPMNAFVNLEELQRSATLADRANLMLAGPMTGQARNFAFLVRDFFETFLRKHGSRGMAARIKLYRTQDLPVEHALLELSVSLYLAWQLKDAGFDLHALPAQNTIELTSERIFLEPAVERLISGASPVQSVANRFVREMDKSQLPRRRLPSNTVPVLTYLANQMAVGTNAAPYSMVTAAGPPYAPADLRDGEIIINQWLADDLQARPGDELALTYFLPESALHLSETTNRFRIRGVVPMAMPHADRTLMPNFPGLSKAESTHEWDAGFPLTHKIRDQDEQYWKQHRGTPKAFVTLRAGQSMWGNRFGNLTAVRFPVPAGVEAHSFATNLEATLLQHLQPGTLGFKFEAIREQALLAASQSQDFGGLFIGFSFFLIIAALILMGLLFTFGLQQRSAEIGTLLALGFTPKRVRKLFLVEGAALAFIGSLIGVAGGILYARAMLHGLTTIWRSATNTSALTFHASPVTILIGLISGTLVAVITIWVVLRRQAGQPARELLAGDGSADVHVGTDTKGSKARRAGALRSVARRIIKAPVIAWASLALAIATVAAAFAMNETSNPEYFFSAGSLALLAGLAFTSVALGRMLRGKSHTHVTTTSLSLRGAARRKTRSVATVALLACGVFLIVSLGVFRLDAEANAWKRSSGTGGFALIGESTLPIVKDLNTAEGRDALGLDEKILQGVSFVPFRVRDGDDASCLNLNRAQQPRLLGVNSSKMPHDAFSFAKLMDNAWGKRSQWSVLDRTATPDRIVLEDNEVAAYGDAASIQWALHKKIGDTLAYRDERGNDFDARLVGGLANSILQGALIIDEAEFTRRFPSVSGYRMFLIDCPSNALPQVSAELTRALQDYGFEATPAAQRLAAFNAVQNTYLSTFQVLGGLGLLLGSAGLGIVVLRNVLERRGELALLIAVGFRRARVQKLVLAEHAALLALGLVIGIVSALVAILPSLLSPRGELPVKSLALTLGGVLLFGMISTWLATHAAVRGNLLEGLRNE
jgi:ABC-type antimicrobial peptide transport system permease subunit